MSSSNSFLNDPAFFENAVHTILCKTSRPQTTNQIAKKASSSYSVAEKYLELLREKGLACKKMVDGTEYWNSKEK